MRMINLTFRLRLDKDQVRELGLDDAVEVGDECQIVGIAKVRKTLKASVGSNPPGSLELELVKFGVTQAGDGAVDRGEPMPEYAERRNAELRGR